MSFLDLLFKKEIEIPKIDYEALALSGKIGTLFTTTLTIPANTPESTPVSTILKLERGLLKNLSVIFKAGCHGYVKVRILYNHIQIMPYNVNAWVTGDKEEVKSSYNLPIDSQPYELVIEGASPSTTYQHTIIVRAMVVLP